MDDYRYGFGLLTRDNVFVSGGHRAQMWRAHVGARQVAHEQVNCLPAVREFSKRNGVAVREWVYVADKWTETCFVPRRAA